MVYVVYKLFFLLIVEHPLRLVATGPRGGFRMDRLAERGSGDPVFFSLYEISSDHQKTSDLKAPIPPYICRPHLHMHPFAY
jgi:hypothetical protein